MVGKKISRHLLENVKFKVLKDVELNNPGIYCIVNDKNGNKYVGQSKYLGKRKRDHFQLLRAGKHNNLHLQRAYNYYGSQFFSFYVLEITFRDYSNLNDREQFWINELKPEYNMVMDVETPPEKKDWDYTEPILIKQGETFERPDWYAWVYGGSECPYINGRAEKQTTKDTRRQLLRSVTPLRRIKK
jgi:group I intron endonuclease